MDVHVVQVMRLLTCKCLYVWVYVSLSVSVSLPVSVSVDERIPTVRPLGSTSTMRVKLPTVDGEVTTGNAVLGAAVSNTITSVPPSITATSRRN